jgi:AcrR family transcriptional regulator
MSRVSADSITGKRGYVSAARTQQARQTRRRVIDAATRLFVAQGYASTTIRAIAAEAGVSIPTVELICGTKAQLLHVVLDVAIAGDDEPIPVLSRAWAQDTQSTDDVRRAGSLTACSDAHHFVLGSTGRPPSTQSGC